MHGMAYRKNFKTTGRDAEAWFPGTPPVGDDDDKGIDLSDTLDESFTMGMDEPSPGIVNAMATLTALCHVSYVGSDISPPSDFRHMAYDTSDTEQRSIWEGQSVSDEEYQVWMREMMALCGDERRERLPPQGASTPIRQVIKHRRSTGQISRLHFRGCSDPGGPTLVPPLTCGSIVFQRVWPKVSGPANVVFIHVRQDRFRLNRKVQDDDHHRSPVPCNTVP
jgi:hypothetical protein